MCSKVMDFLTDDDFINYVLGVTPQSASQWEKKNLKKIRNLLTKGKLISESTRKRWQMQKKLKLYYWLRQM